MGAMFVSAGLLDLTTEKRGELIGLTGASWRGLF
jgi:hypothetical protein